MILDGGALVLDGGTLSLDGGALALVQVLEGGIVGLVLVLGVEDREGGVSAVSTFEGQSSGGGPDGGLDFEGEGHPF